MLLLLFLKEMTLDFYFKGGTKTKTKTNNVGFVSKLMLLCSTKDVDLS